MRFETEYWCLAQDLWAEMYHRTQGVVENYHTDLWHDAIMLNDIFPKDDDKPEGPVSLFYTIREMGTHLFYSDVVTPELEKQLRGGAKRVYRIKVTINVNTERCVVEINDVT